jgi:hypothetical protein
MVIISTKCRSQLLETEGTGSTGRNKNEFMMDTRLYCLDCAIDIHVSTGSMSNLNAYWDLKMCRENKATNMLCLKKKDKSLLSFFTWKPVQQNTPCVISPPPVHAAPILHESTCHSTILTPISNGVEVFGADGGGNSVMRCKAQGCKMGWVRGIQLLFFLHLKGHWHTVSHCMHGLPIHAL